MKKIIFIICLMILLTACTYKDEEVPDSKATHIAESTQTPTPQATPTPKPTETGPYEYTDYFASQQILDDAVINIGNTDRIVAAMQKASRGEAINIGVIGGSITWGASADIDKTYARKLYRWWKKKFPQSKVKLINAGKSGTGSIIGAHRLSHDLLNKNIDFVVVEFAVNDTEEKEVSEAYENIIRQVLEDKNKPGLMLLMMCADKGYSSAEDKIETGLYYNLPILSYKTSVYAAVQRGEFTWDDIADDFIHPDNPGHLMIAEMIIYQLERLYKEIDSKVTVDIDIPEPRSEAFYTNPELLTNETLKVKSLGGFKKDDNANWVLPLGWEAVKKNDKMIFEVTGKTIILVFNQTINNKGANVLVEIDGEEFGVISSKSPYTWEVITSVEILRSSEVATHEITLTMIDDLPQGCSGEEFKLLAVMVSR